MKKLFVLVLTFLVTLGSFAQSSTEGKEFWVALTLCAAPKNGLPEPFIAVSTKRRTTITITNPNDPTWAGVTRQVQGNAWITFTTQDIPLTQWYPTAANNIANAKAQAGQTNNYGLKVSTDADVSVFAALRMANSFDAANILPKTVLQSEYYTQDYPPYIKPDDGESLSMFTILAVENGTNVTITPKTPTADGNAAGVPYTITLNAGQTYYVISQTLQSLSGSHVLAANGKKIAVFQGDVFTQIPGGKAARDCTFEQAMPIDYWGTHFVVTRSLEKDANRIRVTAMENQTDIAINGIQKATIDAGDTYEFELKNSTLSLPSEHTPSVSYDENAVVLETSCPVAVYSYDVSNGYKASTTEMVNDYGDPSMVWISPLEQKINDITFGVCPTDKTKRHFIDIVCLTTDAPLTQLSSRQRPSIALTFQTVTGYPAYSYARVFLVDDDNGLNEHGFHLTNPHGVIAHVYGNGDDESYAYSVGSSAVKRGIQVGNYTLEDESVGSNTYCVNTPITFNAQVGTDIIDTAYWNMGDGVTFTDQSRISFDYTYDTPGWYDVAATVMAHKECPDTVYPKEYINVRIHVVRPDTFLTKKFICEGDMLNYGGKAYTEATTDTVTFDCDSVVIFQLEVGKKSSFEFSTIERDSFVLAGKTYYKSGTYTATLTNASGCDSVVTAYVTVLTCLELSVGMPDSVICADEAEFRIPYVHTKGDIGEAFIVNRGIRTPIRPSLLDNGFVIPLAGFTADHYTNAMVVVEDPLCGDSLRFPVSFDVLYPSSVFNQKWDNTLVLYNKDYNGGYDFKTYQWYKDGQPIMGATEGFYVEEPLDQDSYYQVLLTRYDSVSGDIIELMTCPYYPVSKAAAPAKEAEKVLENGQLHIIKNNTRYSILGVEIRKQEY